MKIFLTIKKERMKDKHVVLDNMIVCMNCQFYLSFFGLTNFEKIVNGG